MNKLFAVLILFVVSPHSSAQKKPSSTYDKHKTYAAFILENDAFVNVNKDDGYTNGMSYVWTHGVFNEFSDSNTTSWINMLTNDLYISTMPGKQRAITYGVAQTINTPDDIASKKLQKNDVPYVGMLSWQANQYAFDDKVVDVLSLTLGIVGPLSLAEQVQKGSHKIIGANKPRGWNHQLDTEPVFRVSAAHNWRLMDGLMSKQFGYDVIGLSKIGVGTIASDINAGVMFRVGGMLTHSFPVTSLLPGREVNPLGIVKKAYYFYIGGVVRYVANDIRIDGNTFSHSHSLNLRHDQYALAAGFSMNLGSVVITLSYLKPSAQVVNRSKRMSLEVLAWPGPSKPTA